VADPSQPMTFGAWCVRDYGFEYEAVRSHHGIAWFPKVVNGKVIFEANSAYQTKEIKILEAREYPEFGIEAGIPIYKQWKDHPNRFDFVAKPQVAQEIWNNFKFE
jgi:glucose-6-phosphate isomerase